MKPETNYSSSGLTIIGGGVSGTALGRLLQLSNVGSLALFEKSRRLGGRASLIPLQSSKQSLALGVHQCFIETKLISEPTVQKMISDEHFIHDLGWRAVTQTGIEQENLYELSSDAWSKLADKLCSSEPTVSLNLSYHVKSLNYDLNQELWIIKGDYWHEQNKQNFEHHTDHLVLSIPPQQAVNLLENTQKDFDSELAGTGIIDRQLSNLIRNLSHITSQSQWVTLLRINHYVFSHMSQRALDESKMIKALKQLSKDESTSSVIVALHTCPKWSKVNIEADSNTIREQCLTELKKLLTDVQGFEDKHIEILKVHRWRYASVTLNEATDSLYLSSLRLGLCGEALLPGSIENGVQRALQSAINLYSEIDLST